MSDVVDFLSDSIPRETKSGMISILSYKIRVRKIAIFMQPSSLCISPQ